MIETVHERQKKAKRDWARNKAAEANEIYEHVEKVVATDRRKRAGTLGHARRNFAWFCRWAFPSAFSMGWSESHERLLARTQRAVLEGGQAAIAMPRGSGKSTIFERAILWAVLCGHRKYPVLICADESKAQQRLRTIKVELETNERLRWLFPHAVVPIQLLERKAIRARSQTYKGKSTYIEWAADRVVMPYVPDSLSAGASFMIGGITSAAVRGPLHTLPDGSSLRPDLVLIDDPQTRESAKSPSQIFEREQIVNADIMGMAGPGKDIAALLACTVIYPDDLADRLLRRDIHPRWQGERVAMLQTWPDDMEWWNQYNDVRENLIRSEQEYTEPSNRMYAEHREIADAGASVYWEDRKLDGDVSAIQHAMNLYFSDPLGFYSEYQNQPKPRTPEDDSLWTSDQIAKKTNGIAKGVIATSASKLVGFIDVQQDILIWCVAAFEPGFGGYVVDYGAYPDQGRIYWEKQNIRRTYQQEAHQHGASNKWESSLLWAIDTLAGEMFSREWKREDGTKATLNRVLVDSKWGKSRELVVMACRKSPYQLHASQGIYIGASSKPMSDYKPRYGEQLGVNWRIATPEGWPIRCVSIDVNWWKSFVHQRWATPLGEKGCLSLFEAKQYDHQMFADHQRSEQRVQTEGRGRTVDEWKALPGDNDFFDCVVGCHVAASIEGIDLVGESRVAINHKAARTKISAAEALAKR